MCKWTKAELDKAHISYTFKDFNDDPTASSEMWSFLRKANVTGSVGIPVCNVCGEAVVQPRDMAAFIEQVKKCVGSDQTTATAPTPPPTPASCNPTCYGNTCDYWKGHGYTCDKLTNTYRCDCSGCVC